MKRHDGSIEKLRQIVANRYGKGLELRPLTDVSGESAEAGFTERGDDLLIPLRVQSAFLGTAVVLRGADLEGDKRSQIAQMVRMVLEPALYRDYLERKENNLTTVVRSHEIPVENLHLFTGPEQEVDETEDEENEEILPRTISAPVLVSSLLHLYGHESQRIKRAALLLHEMTSRWAFLPFQDVAGSLETIQDLLKMGAVTLYVESIESLSPHEQSVILEYIEVPRSAEEPLIITGSTRNPEDLAKVESVRPELRDEAVVNAVDLDRAPLTERGLREVLTLMFFQTRGG